MTFLYGEIPGDSHLAYGGSDQRLRTMRQAISIERERNGERQRDAHTDEDDAERVCVTQVHINADQTLVHRTRPQKHPLIGMHRHTVSLMFSIEW